MVSIKSRKRKEISLNYKKERKSISIPALVSDEFVINLVKKTDKKILDFGAGIGTLSEQILKRYNDKKVYIYEPNSHMYKLLQENFICIDNNRFFITKTFKEIEDIKVDVIICNNVLDHIKNIEKVISYFNNTLNNGGHLILSIPHPFKNAGKWHKSKHLNTFKYDYFKIDNYMTEGEVLRDREDVDGNIIVKDVNSFNRKLETYFKVLFNNNFFVMGLYEPGPQKIYGKNFPIIYNKTSRIPYFLILDCYKNNGGKDK